MSLAHDSRHGLLVIKSHHSHSHSVVQLLCYCHPSTNPTHNQIKFQEKKVLSDRFSLEASFTLYHCKYGAFYCNNQATAKYIFSGN